MADDYVFIDEWDVDAPQEAVFDALADARTYPEWWKPVYIEVDGDCDPAAGCVTQQEFKGRLPYHLKTLSGVTGEVQLDIPAPVTLRAVLDALEFRYPMLRGTIREHVTLKRRPMVRFFVCEEDISLDSPDAALPEKIATGEEPFYIIGAIAGG